MAKQDPRANLQNTRTQINNAAASTQARQFKQRQALKLKRDAEERKYRAATAAAAARAKAEATKTESTGAPPAAEPPAKEEPREE